MDNKALEEAGEIFVENLESDLPFKMNHDEFLTEVVHENRQFSVDVPLRKDGIPKHTMITAARKLSHALKQFVEVAHKEYNMKGKIWFVPIALRLPDLDYGVCVSPIRLVSAYDIMSDKLFMRIDIGFYVIEK